MNESEGLKQAYTLGSQVLSCINEGQFSEIDILFFFFFLMGKLKLLPNDL